MPACLYIEPSKRPIFIAYMVVLAFIFGGCIVSDIVRTHSRANPPTQNCDTMSG